MGRKTAATESAGSSTKKFALSGKQLGEVSIDERLISAQANSQSIKDYIVAIRHNQRQWSACTKTRAEVQHTTAKTHAQKGTGRARHGARSAPQFRGGGVVFGPKPKFDQHVRINKKERRAAIRCLFAEKIREGRVFLVDSLDMKKPQTKVVSGFLKKASRNRRVLFVGEAAYDSVDLGEQQVQVSVASNKHDFFAKSVRNIPKTSFCLAPNLNGYNLMVADEIFLTEEALKQVIDWLC